MANATTSQAAQPLQQVLDQLKDLRETHKSLANEVAELKKPVYGKGQKPGELFGAPSIRRGEDSMGSRGYSYLKAVAFANGRISAEDAKVEVGLAQRLQKSYMDRQGFIKAAPNSFLIPFGSNLICEDTEDASLSQEIRQVVKAGAPSGYDLDELRWMRQKFQSHTKVLDWVDETLGGALVAPPMQGELIEILRNKECFMEAGARVIGMPPQGRITYPRQTGVATAYWVGENQTITDSTQQTGDLVLQAKKLGVLVKIPNELFRFASVSIEQFVRDDIAKVMALNIDKAFLDGTGTSTQPKGIINYANIQTVVASTTGTNGDTFGPTDVNTMIGNVEAQNAVPNAFIMRPLMWYAIANRRADAAVAGDKAGGFMFNWVRDVADGFQNRGLGGLKMVRSNQISGARVKGSGTNLTYILCGDFTDFLVAMGGVIEFLVSVQGDTAVTNDQTWVRGIQYVDGGPRHEASFAFMDTLLQS